jgi:hypothetical protein
MGVKCVGPRSGESTHRIGLGRPLHCVAGDFDGCLRNVPGGSDDLHYLLKTRCHGFHSRSFARENGYEPTYAGEAGPVVTGDTLESPRQPLG